jgi:hypothetical protein
MSGIGEAFSFQLSAYSLPQKPAAGSTALRHSFFTQRRTVHHLQ